MQSLYRALRLGEAAQQQRSFLSFLVQAPRRALATNDGSRRSRGSGSSHGEGPSRKPNSLFHPDNVRDLSPLEVARLRVTYGLVKEHVEALEKNVESVDPEMNPMIDPRSFDVKKLPQVSPDILAQFRQELPPDVAAVSRPVSTHGVWDASKSGESSELGPELQGHRAAEWASVDERTMDSRQFARMQRQSFTIPGGMSFRSDTPSAMPKRKKKVCPLKDGRGRVRVDFRAVATLSSYLTENGKIMPRRKSGLSAKSQRKVARAVKTARTMALLHPEPKARLSTEELLELERTLE